MKLLEAAKKVYAALEHLGEWDEGCFYFGSHATPELQTPLRELDEAIQAHEAQSTLPPGYMDAVHDRIARAGEYLELLEDAEATMRTVKANLKTLPWPGDLESFSKFWLPKIEYSLAAIDLHRLESKEKSK